VALPDLDALLHEELLYLTTIGRKTGEACTIEIWFVIYQRRIYLLAEHGVKAQWVRNIRANPEVTIQIERQRFRARGRILDDVRDRQEWQAVADLSRRKYGWGEGLPISFDAHQAEEQETD
jgi:deazaflavin-dependent oxidoreductase (nitroreductase family)